jgi:hypothetical protein
MNEEIKDPEDTIIVNEVTEPVNQILKGTIIDLINYRINEVRSNNHQPAFVVMSKKSYTSLVYTIRESGNRYIAGVDGDFPTQIFGLPIVMVGDVSFDVRVVTDAKREYWYDPRRA